MKKHLFAKMFSNPKYMNDFLDGKIYMSSLGYFKNLEMEQKTKADKLEGISSYLQSKDLIVEIGFNGITRRLTDLVGPVTIENHGYRCLKVFCMYSPEIDSDHVDRDAKNIKPSQKMIDDFGEDLVWVYDVREFQKRLEMALSETGVVRRYVGQHVEYYKDEFHGTFSDNEIPFKKHELFGFQKEFRIVLKTDDETTDAFVIDIGDIRDICQQFKAHEFNENEFEIKVIEL